MKNDKKIKLTVNDVRSIIKEEIQAKRLERLLEYYEGTSFGSHLKQTVKHLWEADAQLNKALAEVPDDQAHKLVTKMHQAVESLAFQFEGAITKMSRRGMK